MMSGLETGIIASIATQTASKVFDGLMNNKEGLPVKVKNAPSKYTRGKLARIAAVATKSDSPQGTITNPLDTDLIVKNISIIPNSAFKTNGKLVLKLNEVTVFDNDNSTDFTDVSILDIDLPEGKIIEANKTLDVFATGAGFVTIYIQFDKLES